VVNSSVKLHDVSVGAQPPTLCHVAIAIRRREYDHGDVPRRFVGFDPLQHPDAKVGASRNPLLHLGEIVYCLEGRKHPTAAPLIGINPACIVVGRA
jgi:hypothetical protein